MFNIHNYSFTSSHVLYQCRRFDDLLKHVISQGKIITPTILVNCFQYIGNLFLNKYLIVFFFTRSYT